MTILFLILIVVVSVLLAFFVLIQNPKGAGTFSGGIGGAASDIFGVQKTGDILEKTTWACISAILVLAIVSSIWLPKTTAEGKQKTATEQVKVPTNTNPTGTPQAAPISAPTGTPKPAPAK